MNEWVSKRSREGSDEDLTPRLYFQLVSRQRLAPVEALTYTLTQILGDLAKADSSIRTNAGLFVVGSPSQEFQ